MASHSTTHDSLGRILQVPGNSARNEGAVRSLHDKGFQSEQIDETEENLTLFPRSVKKNEIIYVTNQLAIMVDTGISLSIALQGIAAQEENPTLKSILNDVKRNVESGEDFSLALARHPKQFDKTYVSLVRASEQTGTLGETLDQIAIYMRKDLENRNKVRAAMAYPVVMMFLTIAVTIFLLTFVMPKFAPLFERKGVKLPFTTKIMMSMSDLMINYWLFWLIGLAAIMIGFFIGRRTEIGIKILDWAKINAPLMGPISKKIIISRSLRTFGAMVQNGVSMLEAVRLSAEVSGNYYYELAWLRVIDDVTNGRRVAESLAENPLFPKTLVQMIASGEESGKLDYVLKKVSSFYDSDVETSLKTVTSLIEPILIIIMGSVVGCIGLSLLLPVFSLSRAGG